MSDFTRSEQIDLLFASTFQARKTSFSDNVFNEQVLWRMLNANGRVDNSFDGGRHIELPIEVDENNTFGSLGKGGKVSVTPQDNETVAKFEWKTVAGSIVRYRSDDYKNRGKKAIMKMIAQKMNNAQKSAAKEMNRQIYLDGTGNSGKDIEGLARLVADDPTASGSYTTVGGISVSTVPVWKNQTYNATADAFEDVGVAKMRNMLNLCQDGTDTIDFILTSQTLHELYEQEIVTLQNVTPTEGDRNKIADLGFEALWYKRKPVVFDKHMPVSTRMYFLNTDTLYIAMDSNIENFEMTEWQNVPQQPKDRVAYIIWTGNLVCDNRRRNGVIYNFS